MAQNPIRTAATATAGLVTGTLLEAMVKRFGYVLNTGESLGGVDFDVGEPPLVVISADTGFIFFYDATDATTADDGTTCLVSGNGLRYLASSGARPFMTSALTFATAPPGSPTVGDVHIVGVGTGAFAGHDDEIAFRTRRGWRFATPEVGLTILVNSTSTNWQFTSAGWGAFPVELGDGTVLPKALQFPAGIVVEDTLNPPPGSPTVGKFWIVGSAPSGAFVGRAGDLAYWTGSAWAFMDPADGWSAYHKANGFEVFYGSGSWLGGAGSDLQTFSTAGAATWTKPARGTMAFIQCWGPGGSGGKSTVQGNGAYGGGGGNYVERWVPLSSLSSTESVSVGAGGAAVAVAGNGNNGGNTTFGSILTAYGGGGGQGGAAAGGQVGGAGAGASGAGSSGTGGDPLGGATGSPGGFSLFGGGGGAANGGIGGASLYGGGGGGSQATTNAQGKVGGASTYGGGGGGGRGWVQAGGAGGVSQFGGNGGAGGQGGTNGTAGVQPGGGGGGAESSNSGKGGDGRVRVTVF